ncbi:hypothetical protein [Streptomyces scabiei]|uniref:hypothetical protein n=1 Tax=Streptomyces scabiei TaxID=1930 RepID=UPI0029A0DAF7|nr:hypothetical protein [Streptomyces scabiei]MDX3280154.1 hypothetical protein [Streptomyces scabiei]
MKRIRRIAAALALATAAGTGVLLVDDLLATADADTAWGAPATTHTDADLGVGVGGGGGAPGGVGVRGGEQVVDEEDAGAGGCSEGEGGGDTADSLHEWSFGRRMVGK